MQVICVIKPNMNTAFPGVQWPPIEVGDEFTVAEIEECQGRTWYAFVGIDERFVYDAEMFAPTNGPDENAIFEERLNQEIDALDRVWEGIVKEMDKMENA